MKQSLSALFGRCLSAFYLLAFGVLALAHVYATVLAYHYLYAWKSSRALLWVMMTFLVPVVSTVYWLIVHWAETGVFWNWLTLACAVGLGLMMAGMLVELATAAMRRNA